MYIVQIKAKSHLLVFSAVASSEILLFNNVY